MKIETFNVGLLSTNCYVISCIETEEAIIVDPGIETLYEAQQINRYVNDNSLNVVFIVNTHGHADHISGDTVFKRKYSVPVCIHTCDAECLNHLVNKISPANVLLRDGSLLKFGQITLKVMHTPGHTLGSISFVGKNRVFTGDTLFAGGIGRTDFIGGSDRDMRASLQKLASLPNDFVVHPGHGSASTIGLEKNTNPFLNIL